MNRREGSPSRVARSRKKAGGPRRVSERCPKMPARKNKRPIKSACRCPCQNMNTILMGIVGPGSSIQAVLVAVGKSSKRRSDKGFTFLKFTTCGSCGYCITGEQRIKKSGRRYRYYRCTRKSKTFHCNDRSYLPHEQFAEEVTRNTQLAAIPDEWKEKFLARIETWEGETSQVKQAQIDQLKSELAAIKAKINRINDGFADGALDI